MLQRIAPLQYFPISRVIPNVADSTTYYVRAVVRNASTGAVLATVPLLAQGSQIYSAIYRAPALASSQGLFLTITTTVYTDAGYSVLSELYGQDQDTFQIYDDANNSIIMAQQIAATVAGSIPDNSPADVNYKKIEKIVVSVLASTLPGVIAEILKLQKQLEESTKNIPEKVDLSPVLKAIEAKTFEVDHSPILEAIEKKQFDWQPLERMLKPIQPLLGEMREKLFGEVQENPMVGVLDKVHDIVKSFKQKHADMFEVVKDIQKRQKKTPVLSVFQPQDDPALPDQD